ncbi:MAG: bifunctional folylpolyglutamate synthase/dihydrofolate synthase [Bauldia sp.]|nr:bifunctional folylpolyglutamate synthase/dihydrofolate synthase [Bauldia sp.]
MDRSSAILDRLLGLHPRQIDLSLDRIERLLEALGRPDRRLPPAFHIAGTNGKGSTTAFLRAILEAAGNTVHVYTSPHLVRFHERIRLGAIGGGRFVDDEALADALLKVERVNDGAPITHFEITTAAAFELFASQPADYLLLEVGLGGRLDATNVIDDPLAAVITPLSLDHERFLGVTVPEIAAEKAGIIKPRRPVVTAPQPPDAMSVIERIAARKRAPLHAAGQEWLAYAEHGRLVFQDEGGLLDLPPPKLPGRHQFTNAGTAIAALRVAKLRVRAQAIEAGLTAVEWPARMQRLTNGRLVALAGDGIAELWLDGGHNPAAAVVVAEALADLEERSPRPLYLVTGMLTTKDPVGFFRPFAGLAREVVTVPVGDHEAFPPQQLAEIARSVGLTATSADSVEAALLAVGQLNRGNPPARVLICGSLYLAGQVLETNGTPPG